MHVILRSVCCTVQTFRPFFATHLANAKQAFHITLSLLEEFYCAEQYEVNRIEFFCQMYWA